MSEPMVLIVDEDKQFCEYLEKIFSTWGMAATNITNPFFVAGEIRRAFYNVILVDISMSAISGVDLFVEIGQACPDTRIIVMAGSADKENAINALKFQAFDFLEKPFLVNLLFHTVKRALDDQRIAREHKKILEILTGSHQTLFTHASQLEQLNRAIMHLSRELSAFVQTLEESHEDKEERAFLKIRSLITSIIKELRRDEHMKKYETQLVMLESYMEELSSSLTSHLEGTNALSLTELRVASMIKNGMKSEEIAEILHISPDTVKTHRRNIRRKLEIVGTKSDLGSYLQSICKTESGKLEFERDM